MTKNLTKNSPKIHLTLLQYPITPDRFENFKTVSALLEKTIHSKKFKKIQKNSKNTKDQSWIVCPEMWLGGPSQRAEAKEWGEFYEDVLKHQKEWCRKNKVGLIFSQLTCTPSSRSSRQNMKNIQNIQKNTFFAIDSHGKILARYDKVNLFAFGGETKIYSAGKKLCLFNSKNISLAGIICFDLRFPELARELTFKKAKVLFVPAQWPSSRREHWLTLLRARAIENQIFVVGVNRLGSKGNDIFSGDSVVFDPWGNCLLQMNDQQQSGFVTLDLNNLKEIRKKFPFLPSVIGAHVAPSTGKAGWSLPLSLAKLA